MEEEEKGGCYGGRARVRQMSAAVLNAGVITSTVAWPQAPHPRLTHTDLPPDN